MLLTEYDYETDIEVQREEALQEGIKTGLARGKQEEKLETAQNLKNKGIPFNIISECTGLSIEQIESL